MEVHCKHHYRYLTLLLPCPIYHPKRRLGVALCDALLAAHDSIAAPVIPAGEVVHLHGKDVVLARLITDSTQHICKPGKNVKIYAVFNMPEVVLALRSWVAAAGNFEGFARGDWLRDQLNALIRARPSNSQCTERAVQAAHQSSGKGYGTKGIEALTSRKMAVLHEMREVFKIAGCASRQPKVAASVVLQTPARVEAAETTDIGMEETAEVGPGRQGIRATRQRAGEGYRACARRQKLRPGRSGLDWVAGHGISAHEDEAREAGSERADKGRNRYGAEESRRKGRAAA